MGSCYKTNYKKVEVVLSPAVCLTLFGSCPGFIFRIGSWIFAVIWHYKKVLTNRSRVESSSLLDSLRLMSRLHFPHRVLDFRCYMAFFFFFFFRTSCVAFLRSHSAAFFASQHLL